MIPIHETKDSAAELLADVSGWLVDVSISQQGKDHSGSFLQIIMGLRVSSS